jgi:hypothetical protein
MYITDTIPSTDLQSGLAGWAAEVAFQQDRVLAVEDEHRH